MCTDCSNCNKKIEKKLPENELWQLYRAAYKQYQSEILHGQFTYHRFVERFVSYHLPAFCLNEADARLHIMNVFELKDLLDPDRYLISDIEYEGDNTGNRFIFSLLFSVYSGNDIDKIKKFTDLFVMDDDFVFAKKSTDIFLSLIATAMNTSNIENVMDVFPDIDYARLLDHNWISTFIDETYKAIDTIFDVLNDNEDSVFWEIIQYYDMLGNLLHYHDMCTLKLDGPFYFNDNNKENMFYIQQCSLGPVWYFEKGFKLNKKGDK